MLMTNVETEIILSQALFTVLPWEPGVVWQIGMFPALRLPVSPQILCTKMMENMYAPRGKDAFFFFFCII